MVRNFRPNLWATAAVVPPAQPQPASLKARQQPPAKQEQVKHEQQQDPEENPALPRKQPDKMVDPEQEIRAQHQRQWGVKDGRLLEDLDGDASDEEDENAAKVEMNRRGVKSNLPGVTSEDLPRGIKMARYKGRTNGKGS